MVDVPIHQEDLVVQRTPLIDPVISNGYEKTNVQEEKEFRSAGWCKENSDRQKTVAEDRIPTVAAVGQRHVNSQPYAHTSYF
ncbi:hypothetical protein Tco_0140871 [Tanacetum coccineum]